jgi:hypothetical protein
MAPFSRSFAGGRLLLHLWVKMLDSPCVVIKDQTLHVINLHYFFAKQVMLMEMKLSEGQTEQSLGNIPCL